FSSRRRHTIFSRDWSSDVCSSDLADLAIEIANRGVVIDRRALDLVQRIEAAGALVDAVHDEACDRNGLGPVPIDISQRVEELVRSEERRVGTDGRLRWVHGDSHKN